MSFIPYPPSVYNLDYDRLKELSNRIYILCEEFRKNLDKLHVLRTTLKKLTKDIQNLVSLKYLCEYETTIKETYEEYFSTETVVKTVNMIEAKPLEINYLLGREWELPQINKPETKYPTSSSIYQNKDRSSSITFGNYKTINIEPESDSETESEHVNVVNIEEPEIVLNIETVENLYRN